MTENEVIAVFKRFKNCDFCLYETPLLACRDNDCFELDLQKLAEYFKKESEVE
jgi:hypothetical protein